MVASSNGGKTKKDKNSTKIKKGSLASGIQPVVPTVLAARTRLYDIVDKDDLKVKNKEGLTFTIPRNDVVWIGEHKGQEFVTKSEMSNVVLNTRSFTFIRFKKMDGTMRDMYCSITNIVGNDVFLKDLQKTQDESDRRCKLENVYQIISKNKMYIRKK